MVLAEDAALDEILRAGIEEVRKIYKKDKEVLSGGAPRDQERIGQRHVLSVLPIPKNTIDRVSLKALEAKVALGTLEGITAADLRGFDSAPTFSEVTPDKISGAAIWDRGFLVTGYKLLGNNVLKTFYKFFKDDARRKQAASGQEFAADLTKYMKEKVSDPVLRNVLERFRPESPVYNKKNILANQLSIQKTCMKYLNVLLLMRNTCICVIRVCLMGQ